MALLRLMYARPIWGEVQAEGQVARVKAVAEDGRHMHIEYRNGLTGRISSDEEQISFGVGDILLVDAEGNHFERAPDSLWPDDTWIGTLRLEVSDGFIAEVDGRYRRVYAQDAGYAVGNTVEGHGENLSHVLNERPIRPLDTGGVDESTIAEFRASPDASKIGFEDFGGLHEVVSRAQELIELPLKHHDALAKIGARPVKGVLFTGRPGTGKTMLARIIANRADANFYEIRGPEIFSKWYGESEGILRGIFDHASKHGRSIIFFDEIDSVAAQRGESHEASRRVVAQLLSLMDGFTPKDEVMVVATTNRPQDIDGALRRPGRLDWEINFPLPGLEDRREILEVSARKLQTAGSLPHSEIADKTNLWSSAELTAIWTEAALIAVADNGREAILAEDYLAGYDRVAALRMRSIEAMVRENEGK